MSLRDEWAERFEAEGKAAFQRSSGGNPYNAGTMAHDRWAKGFMEAYEKARLAGKAEA
jgi:hypothetical protein